MPLVISREVVEVVLTQMREESFRADICRRLIDENPIYANALDDFLGVMRDKWGDLCASEIAEFLVLAYRIFQNQHEADEMNRDLGHETQVTGQ